MNQKIAFRYLQSNLKGAAFVFCLAGVVPSHVNDGARLRPYCRDQSVLIWLLRCQSTRQEDHHHIQTVVRTAQLSGRVQNDTSIVKEMLTWNFK